MIKNVSRWVRFSAGAFGRYAMAVLVTAICLLGRWLLDPKNHLSEQLPPALQGSRPTVCVL